MGFVGSQGPSFDRDTPALRFGGPMDPNVRWVLWPVLAWRVVAPVANRRPLNMFQRAVLQLARAGTSQYAEIAECLLIDSDLAALVMVEMQAMSLVDHEGRVTDRGSRLLEDLEDEPPEELSVGHVLADPFSGKLWPRFIVDDLPVADVEMSEDGWPILLSGSAGDPWRDRPFVVQPGVGDAVNASRPSAAEILRATSRHARQRDYDEVEDDRVVPGIKRVSFVDDEPEPYLVALCLKRHESGDWMVEDPFGHGESHALREALEKRLDRDERLRRWVAPLVGADGAEPMLGQLQNEAKWKVEERLTVAIRQHEVVQDRLVAMQRALLEAQLYDAPLDKWDDVLLKAQRAVERTLLTLSANQEGRGQPTYRRLSVSDKEFNSKHLDTIAEAVGFDVPIPRGVGAVRRGKVQYAESKASGSLRPLLVLSLLRADRDQAHPLRRAAQAHPDLLQRLDDLAHARDHAAHDGADTWASQVQARVDTVFDTVESLLLSERTE